MAWLCYYRNIPGFLQNFLDFDLIIGIMKVLNEDRPLEEDHVECFSIQQDALSNTGCVIIGGVTCIQAGHL